jgi:hypothetical protein
MIMLCIELWIFASMIGLSKFGNAIAKLLADAPVDSAEHVPPLLAVPPQGSGVPRGHIRH